MSPNIEHFYSGDIFLLNALPIVLLFFQNLAFGKNYPWSYLPHDLGRWIWLALSAFVVIWMVRPQLYPPEKVLKIASTRLAFVFLLFLNGVNLSFSYYRFQQFGYELPILHFGILAFTLILTCTPMDRLKLSFIASLGLLAASIFHFPVHPDRSDMLPVIQSGLDRWSMGSDPYAPVLLGGRMNLMGYWPGTLFTHWPAWVLGLDLRWNSFFFRILWMGMALGVISKKRIPPSHPFVVGLTWFALSPQLSFRHELYFEAFFAMIAAYLLYPRTRWILLPLMVVTRQWAWVFAPFLFFAEIFSSKKSPWKTEASFLLGTILVGGICYVLLFQTTSLVSFQLAVFWFQKVLDQPLYPGDYGLTFSPLLFRLGWANWTQKIQALICFIVLAWASNRFRSMRKQGVSAEGVRNHWYGAALIAWGVFLALNMHFWLYFMLSPVVFQLFWLASRTEDSNCSNMY